MIRYRQDEMNKALELQREALKLNLPSPPVLSWEAKVTKPGELKDDPDYVCKCNSYTRNGLHLLAMAGAYPSRRIRESLPIDLEYQLDDSLGEKWEGGACEYNGELYFTLLSDAIYYFSKYNPSTKVVTKIDSYYNAGGESSDNYPAVQMLEHNGTIYITNSYRVYRYNTSIGLVVVTLPTGPRALCMHDGDLYVSSNYIVYKVDINTLEYTNCGTITSGKYVQDLVSWNGNLYGCVYDSLLGDNIYIWNGSTSWSIFKTISTAAYSMYLRVINNTLFAIVRYVSGSGSYRYIYYYNGVDMVSLGNTYPVSNNIDGTTSNSYNTKAIVCDGKLFIRFSSSIICVSYEDGTYRVSPLAMANTMSYMYSVGNTIYTAGSDNGTYSIGKYKLNKKHMLFRLPNGKRQRLTYRYAYIDNTSSPDYLELGTGVEESNIDNYKLELLGGDWIKGVTSRETVMDEEQHKLITTIVRTFTNNSGGPVSLTEAGLYVYAVNGIEDSTYIGSNEFNSGQMLTVRDLFPVPIVVDDGETITFTYKLQVAYPE